MSEWPETTALAPTYALSWGHGKLQGGVHVHSTRKQSGLGEARVDIGLKPFVGVGGGLVWLTPWHDLMVNISMKFTSWPSNVRAHTYTRKHARLCPRFCGGIEVA